MKRSSGLLFTAVILLMSTLTSAETRSGPPAIFDTDARVLFTGDSITDMNRGRGTDPNHILGHSYAFLLGARHGAAFPEQRLTFINRGISGNRVADLVKRWKTDTLDLHPDVLSILIGTNDVLAINKDQSFDPDAYEKNYDALLADARAANPKLKLVLCEPFSLPGKQSSLHAEAWNAAMKKVQAAVDRLAKKYNAPVVRLQAMFDAATARAPVDYWIWDGIHPTYSGQQLIADEWERTYAAFYDPPIAATQKSR